MPNYLSETSSGKGASSPQERRVPAEKALPSLTQLWSLRGAQGSHGSKRCKDSCGKCAVVHSSCILLSILILFARAVMSEEGGIHKTEYCPGI